MVNFDFCRTLRLDYTPGAIYSDSSTHGNHESLIVSAQMGHQINQNEKTKSRNQEKWIISDKEIINL